MEARDQFLRGRGGDMGKAIEALESVVREDPTYRDSLTLLARAYYNQGRYKDSYNVLRYALGINKEDEIAWLVLGMTQLRLGENENGLETIKSALTVVSKASKNGYRDFAYWDRKDLVRSAIRRTVLLATKGLEEKENLIRAAEAILVRMDSEENILRIEEPRERMREAGR